MLKVLQICIGSTGSLAVTVISQLHFFSFFNRTPEVGGTHEVCHFDLCKVKCFFSWLYNDHLVLTLISFSLLFLQCCHRKVIAAMLFRYMWRESRYSEHDSREDSKACVTVYSLICMILPRDALSQNIRLSYKLCSEFSDPSSLLSNSFQTLLVSQVPCHLAYEILHFQVSKTR